MCHRFSILLLLLLLAGCAREKVDRIEWTVMGTVAAVQWKGELKNSPEIIEATKGVFADVERLLNAHDPDSELSRLAKLSDAAALRDIGSHFPDTDAKWKGADSAKLLAAVVAEIAAAGYRVGNVDATVVCERPKLRPKVDEIRSRLARLLDIPTSQLSIKGKTNEKMDDVGAGLGIEAHAVVLLEENA